MASRFIPITSAPVRSAKRFIWATWFAAFLPLFFGGWYYALRSADMAATGAWWPNGALSFLLGGIFTLALAALPVLNYLYGRAYPPALKLLVLTLIAYISLAIVQIVNWVAAANWTSVGQLIAPLLWGGLALWSLGKLRHPQCVRWAAEVSSWSNESGQSLAAASLAAHNPNVSGATLDDAEGNGPKNDSPKKDAPKKDGPAANSPDER